MTFDLSIEHHDAGVAVASIQGDFDLRCAADARSALVGLFDAGVRRLVVDMTETTFLDSTALGALVGVLKRARALDAGLDLVCADRSIVRIFDITGLDRVFPLHRTLGAALAPRPVSLT